MADLETQTPVNEDTRDVVAAELDKLQPEETQEVEQSKEIKEKVNADQAEQVQEPVQESEELREEQPQPYRNPFSAWKKEAQTVLSQLPQDTQKYIIEREEQFHKGIQIYKNDAMFGRSVLSEVKPYLEHIEKQGLTVEKAVSHLLKAEKMLRDGSDEQRAMAFRALAHDYGIDVQSLAQIPFDARGHQLERQLAEQKLMLEQLSQSRQTEQEAQLNQTIEQFAQTHEHFHEVNEVMADLLEKGFAYDLEDAYLKAIKLNDIQPKQVVDIQKANQAAKAAKAAAVSVKGSPVGVTKQPEPKTTEDAVRAAMANYGL